MKEPRISFASSNILIEQSLRRCKTKEDFLKFLQAFPLYVCRSKKQFKMYQDKAREVGAI